MKIAICMSGHMRNFYQTFAAFKKYVLSLYDCDVFIHTWDNLGYQSNYKGDYNGLINDNHIKDINSAYNPKKLFIENSNFIETLKLQGNQYAPHLINCPKHVGNMASMFYKIYASNELRKQYEIESGTKYDVVIRTRPDLGFHGDLTIPENIEEKNIYIPAHISGEGWYCDQFAFGLPHDMDLYASLFLHIPEYFTAKNEYFPEKFVAWGFNKLGLIPRWHTMHFNLLR